MSLYIGNLSSRIRRDELERVFRRFGRCSLRVKDGYGFVVYDFPPNAEKALRALQRRYICGEPLTLSWSNKQPRQFDRLAKGGGRSYESQHGRDSVRGKLGLNDQSVVQSHGVSRLRDKEVRYYKDRVRDELGEVHSGYREEFLDEGDRFGCDRVDNDRWGEQLHDQPNENDVQFERYEPYGEYEKKCDSGLRDSRKDVGRDNSEEVNLNHPRDAKSQITCYKCGGSGHKMSCCPQKNSSLGKSTRFDARHDDDINRRGGCGIERKRSRSRTLERSSRDLTPGGLFNNDMKSPRLGKHEKPMSNVSSPTGNVIDKSLKKYSSGNKRIRKEKGSPKRHDTKKARKSFSSSLRSKSHLSSQSSEHVQRSHSRSRLRSISSRTRSLSSKSRSTSTSSSSQLKSKSLTSSRRSLSVSLGQPLPSSSNKEQLTLKGFSANVTTQEVLIGQEPLIKIGYHLEDAILENRTVARNNESEITPSKGEVEMDKGQPLRKNTEDHQIASCSPYEVRNPGTMSVEKGIAENGRFSPKNSAEICCRDSDKSMKEHFSAQMDNPDSGPPTSSSTGHPLGIPPQELNMVLKHYYGHDLQIENQRHLHVEEYFGSARMWPWEIIYYRRSKKGPISIENYTRRLDQNKEFGIVDKYIRSSSGWGELAQENH